MDEERPQRRAIDSQVAILCSEIRQIKEEIHDIKNQLSKKYVTDERFVPVERLVYGFTGIILVGFISALVVLVIRS